MAEELYDGEFWLPSEILTDDDILTDFFGSGSGSGSYSSSEPCSVLSDDELKASVLLTSPKSTLFGCASPNRPVSPPKDNQANNNNNNNNNNKTTTLNLLNKAAGEVAKIKGEKSAGTGFFDCSNTSKRNSVPPPSQPAQQTFTYFAPPVYYYPQFSPYMNWAPVPVQAPPQKQKQEKKASKNKSSSASKKSNEGNNSGINSTLDLSPAAWPPLPGQAKSQPEPQPQPPLQTQPMARTSVGTGVFFPRVIASPATEPQPEPKMKSDETVNATKTKKKKGSKRSNSCPVEVNLDDIQLPSEWVY